MSVVDSSVADGIGHITLNRPEQLNTVTVELGSEFEAALRALGADPAVRVLAVRGAGGNFCAGGDFEEVSRLRQGGPDALRPLFDNFRAACSAVAQISVPVVAVVEGAAAAGGFEFMQAADIVLVRDDATIADNHIRFGQIPGGGSTARLPRLLGRQRALGLLLAGDRLSGLDAVRLGLAYRSWPADGFDSGVDTFLRTLAGRRPEAVAAVKSLVYEGMETTLAEGLRRERDAVVAHIAGEAGDAGVRAFDGRNHR